MARLHIDGGISQRVKPGPPTTSPLHSPSISNLAGVMSPVINTSCNPCQHSGFAPDKILVVAVVAPPANPARRDRDRY